MTTREDDEAILALLRLRSSGVGVNEIAKTFGIRRLVVTKLTNNVMSADIVYSGEPVEEIMKGYWN